MLQLTFILLLLMPVCYYYFRKKQTSPPLPPGPRRLPIIGNLLDLPPKGIPEYQHWLRFKDIYGPISSITVFGQPTIILHDKKAAHDILEKMSLKTAMRPRNFFSDVLCGFGSLLPSMQYDGTYREHRKLIHRQLGTTSGVREFRGIQDVESHRFLLRILNDSGNIMNHIKTEAAAIILQITYGYSIEPDKPDPLVLLIERMMHNFSRTIMPLAWPVNFFPILNYIPEILPGMSFKYIARQSKTINRLVVEVPYSFVRHQMAKGVHQASYVSSALGQQSSNDALDGNGNLKNKDMENAIKTTAAIMYAGGADTTVTAIASFILAMTLFPEVQQKAQQEIDTVIGEDRLPRFEDRENLPYVNALVKETLRWLPVTPTSITHMVDEELIYDGFRIPKGAYLIPSVWWFLHEPSIHSDPESFDPERYLEPRNEPDPVTEAFGYGRRLCPGRYLADENLFLTISRLLAAFNITKAIDEYGNEIIPEIKISPGSLGRPLNLPHNIKPRSARAVDIIRSIEVEHPFEKGDSEFLTQDLMKEWDNITKGPEL